MARKKKARKKAQPKRKSRAKAKPKARERKPARPRKKAPAADDQALLPGIPESADGLMEPTDRPKSASRMLEARRATAADLAKGQREISVSEFFMKNRHLLGFDSPRKALLTTVKEAVDNSLDACEEAGVLPRIDVRIKPAGHDRFRISILDNGPGIVKRQIPRIFGKLLYGSKFHRLKQSRGQQGIGISAAGMYGMLTTGKSVIITSKPQPRKEAHHYEIQIDSKRNEPQILLDQTIDWESPYPTGTEVTIELEAQYKKGKHSVDTFLEQTAIANPHATIWFTDPDGKKHTWEASTEELPPDPREIKPHPRGVEFGILLKMLKSTKARNVQSFLKGEFSRVSPKVAGEILGRADIAPKTRPGRVATQQMAEALYQAMNAGDIRILAPPTNCISPIGHELIEKSLRAQLDAEFYTAVTRPPTVYRGNPFQVEAGIAYGGPNAKPDSLVKVMRFANRVPLLYQPGGCVITNAVLDTDWRNYKMSQSRGALPTGPAVLFVHVASVWVPFTSESKEAIAQYPEIHKEIKLAMQECGRALGRHLSSKARAAHEAKRRRIFEVYIDELVESAGNITRLNKRTLRSNLVRIARSKTVGGGNGEEEEE